MLNAPMLTAILSNLNRSWEACQEIFLSITDSNLEAALKAEAQTVWDEAEKLKDDLENRVQKLLFDQQELSKLKFKPIEPPSFSGQFKDWPKFRRAFEDIIVFNTHMPDAEKTSHLLGALSGEPRKNLELMQSSTGTFNQTWNLLIKTYHNPRKIALDILQGLFSLPKSSYASAEGMRRIHSTIESSLQAFDEMKISTASWDLWILDAVSKSLDTDSRRLFEEQLEDDGTIPNRQVILDFLLKRQHVLESITGQNRPSQGPSRPNYYAGPQSPNQGPSRPNYSGPQSPNLGGGHSI